ncbi:MAG: hypothetical protein ACI83P_002103 [Janthinobacterium sp.]|jgi:hypothetical protein
MRPFALLPYRCHIVDNFVKLVRNVLLMDEQMQTLWIREGGRRSMDFELGRHGIFLLPGVQTTQYLQRIKNCRKYLQRRLSFLVSACFY